MNIVVLKGNLTRDPELRHVGSDNTAVVNFTVAVNRRFKRADGTQDQETTFVDCEAWDSGAEALNQYVKKGDPILVHGALKLDVWETDGQKRSKLKVRVSKFEMLYRASDAKGSTSSGSSSQSSNEDINEAEAEAADAEVGGDIPF